MSRRTKAVIGALVAVAVLAGLVVAALHLVGGGHGAPTAARHPTAGPTTAASTSVLTPVSAEALDETNNNASAALGNSSSGPWQTQFYDNNPEFGGLKTGSGLVLDMGHSVRVSSVTVTFGSIPGADVQIRVGTPTQPLPASSTSSPADDAFASALNTVAQQTNVPGGSTTFSVKGQASGQYVLIWFTKLPPMAGQQGKYQADVYNIVVKGSSG
jgi:hypothetical protein